MEKYLERLLFTGLFLCLVLEARAGLFFGIRGGSELSRWESKQRLIQDDVEYNLDNTGFSEGLSLGVLGAYTRRYFFIGTEIEYTQLDWDIQPNESTSVDDNWRAVKADRLSVWGLLGIKNIKNTWGVWAGATVYQRLIFQENNNPRDLPATYEGRAYKIGVGKGFGRANRIRLNVELIQTSYDTITRDGSTSALPADFGNNTYTNLDNTIFLFSISITWFKSRGNRG